MRRAAREPRGGRWLGPAIAHAGQERFPRRLRFEPDEVDVDDRAEQALDESGTDEGDRLDVLATLIDAYETKYDPIDPPDPIEAIKFRMEQQGLSRKDLQAWIGTRTRVAEVLSGKRGLSIGMIRCLHEGLDIAAEILIRQSSHPGRTPYSGRLMAAAAVGRTATARRSAQAGARESKAHLGGSAVQAGGAARGRRSSGPSSRGGWVREDRKD